MGSAEVGGAGVVVPARVALAKVVLMWVVWRGRCRWEWC